ncbi:MAG: ABC transporter substrate-binding protein, partial [Deltaproteobacteria bacterium]|nr:ABC transporter substrate-binding protein [Deltaproteobacteria bacterium]
MQLVILFLLIFLSFVFTHPSEAQQTDNIPRVGFLQRRLPPTLANPDPLADAFKQGLRELGYIEGQNLRLEHRYAGGKSDRLPGLIAELVQLKVDVLVIPSSQAIRIAKQTTTTIPIVIVTPNDPVATGFVDSLARPGGNITGITRLTRNLSGKRLELLKEVVPEISRVGILTGTTTTGGQEFEAVARELKITIQSLEVRGPNPDFEGAFQVAARERVNALIAIRDAVTASYPKRIAELAIKHRLPSMNEDSPYVESGGLMSYAANDAEQFRRAAYYVDKILKG